jgi:uncharacterized protein YciI
MSVYVVTLRFTEQRHRAPSLMDAHNAWLRRGFADGIFLLAGGLADKAGGALLATAATPELLQRRLDEDPFVAEGIVAPAVVAFTPQRADARLGFLVEAGA